MFTENGNGVIGSSLMADSQPSWLALGPMVDNYLVLSLHSSCEPVDHFHRPVVCLIAFNTISSSQLTASYAAE